MPEDQTTIEFKDSLMVKLNKEKEIANEFQKRRHEDWNDNYELYRNKIRTNRLTQRQAVNIPLMKETLKTLQSKIDEPPSITFKELNGERDKEIILQERWNDDFERLNFEGIDVQDKKTVLLYGRGFKKLNYANGEFDIDALDIYDVVIDPLVDPIDIDSARFLCHQNIFRSLEEVMEDKRYSNRAKRRLKTYMNTTDAIIQSGKNKEALEMKQERLSAMGIEESKFEKFSAGQVLLNLTEHYTWLWDKKKQKFVRYVMVYVDDTIRLLKSPLKSLLGVEFLPFVTWGDDVETQDFWSDGPADLVRTPNKVVNVFISQMVENRALKNFQMHWYDSTKQGFQPQTLDPGPGRLLPAFGPPKETVMPVEISGLEDALTQIDFLIKLVERGTSATAIEKGVSEKKQITLGEVEMLVGKAMERTMSMAKFYRRAWKELAQKWYKILEANDKGSKTYYKVSAKGNIWPKKVTSADWKSKSGYRVEAQSSSEQEAEKTSGLQKMMVVKQQFPANRALQRIIQRRTLEMIDLTPEELREVEEEEKKMMESAQQPVEGVAQPAQEDTGTLQRIQQGVGELADLNSRI